jgi:hypothetical protein
LVGELEDRDAGQVNLLVAGQRQQHVDRPFEAIKVQDQLAFHGVVHGGQPWPVT